MSTVYVVVSPFIKHAQHAHIVKTYSLFVIHIYTSCFKTVVKRYILDNSFYSLDEYFNKKLP